MPLVGWWTLKSMGYHRLWVIHKYGLWQSLLYMSVSEFDKDDLIFYE